MSNNVAKIYEYFKLNRKNKLYGFYVHELIKWEHQLTAYFIKNNMMVTIYIQEYSVRVETKLFGPGQFDNILLDQSAEYVNMENLGDIISDVLDYDGMIHHSVSEMQLDWREDKVVGFMQ